MTSKIGLFSYLRQAGTVHLHERKEISDELYNQLVSAQKMIKIHLKKSDLRVDIYDATNAPKDKFVYMREPGNVYVEVTDLLRDKTSSEEFWSKKESDEPLLRRIFRFIDKATGCDDPMKEFRNATRRKYNRYLIRKQEEQAAKEMQVPHFDSNKSELQVPRYDLSRNQQKKKIAV